MVTTLLLPRVINVGRSRSVVFYVLGMPFPRFHVDPDAADGPSGQQARGHGNEACKEVY